jgi:hypothetical protein
VAFGALASFFSKVTVRTISGDGGGGGGGGGGVE